MASFFDKNPIMKLIEDMNEKIKEFGLEDKIAALEVEEPITVISNILYINNLDKYINNNSNFLHQDDNILTIDYSENNGGDN